MPPTPTADDDIPIPPNPNRPLDPHNHTPVPTHMLTLTSYSHRRGPLHPSPSPGLTFDVRALPNASKRLRDMCVGTDKALREALMAEGKWGEKVREVEAAVREVLKGFGEVREAEEIEEECQEDEEQGCDEGEGENKEPIHIRVGICCEMGRHRSVACVEELARRTWPPGWHVQVLHRDLKRPRSERDKEKRSKISKLDRFTDESD
ncbi:hypothetical protein C0989_006523 [Termitomyces sp. Mn162]|nr:hypothetical protein C0989_006523 [Termitomyces sp. Mn162]KAH0589792.1 hypothetical protein H2248_005507 [Termitomyces sp. 'cryptogamus']